MYKYLCLVVVLVSICISCKNEEVYIPKPRTYPRVAFPDRNDSEFSQKDCPFTMSYPDYFKVQKERLQNEEGSTNKCWFDLFSPELNSYLYFSYIPIDDGGHFDRLVEDAFELADKHNVKADYRDEIKIDNSSKNVQGLIFEIQGPVATPLQFYLTDSTNHFLRGSLYFGAKVNRDSIAPIYDFVKDDLELMIKSFQWQ